MHRTIQTAHYIDAQQERWRALNEIDAVRLLICVVMRLLLNVYSYREFARK